jgi:hypothetical protein
MFGGQAVKDRSYLRRSTGKNPLKQRSIVTNGKKLVADLDGRSSTARRYKDLCSALSDDLGGVAALNAGQTALIRQAAAMVVQSEKLQVAVLRGEIVDVEALTRLANAATRIIGALRRSRETRNSRLEDGQDALAAHLEARARERGAT